MVVNGAVIKIVRVRGSDVWLSVEAPPDVKIVRIRKHELVVQQKMR